MVIERKRNKFNNKADSNYEFAVQRTPIYLPVGKDTLQDLLWRDDREEYLSTVSRSYELTTHKECHDIVAEILSKVGIIANIERVGVTQSGNRFFEWMSFPDMKFQIPGEDDSQDATILDNYKPSIILKNSYDKSSPVKIEFGAIRLICQNGLVSTHISQTISTKHSSELNIQRIAEVLEENIEKHIVDFQDRIQILKSQSANLYINLIIAQQFNRSIIKSIIELSTGLLTPVFNDNGLIVDINMREPVSAYHLLNLMTQVLTHNTKSIENSVVGLSKVSQIFNI